MKVYKNTWFERFAKKQRLNDKALLDAVARAEKGQIDADLGSGVIKQRVARSGQGKSGGFGALIVYRKAWIAVFIYGFSKNEKGNIKPMETRQFKRASTYLLKLTGGQLEALVDRGYFTEVKGNGKEV